MLKLYSVNDILSIESKAIQNNISEDKLMKRAGTYAADYIIRNFPYARSAIVFCGSGNNGGDGYIIAKLLKLHGMNIKVLFIENTTQLKSSALSAYNQYDGISTQFDSKELINADIIIDALLGIGIKGNVSDDYKAAIEKINQSGKPVVSIDIPSGINADTGSVCGTAVKADHTVTFIGLKRGLFTGEALNYCGKIVNSNLDIPEEWLNEVPSYIRTINIDDLKKLLAPREKYSSKKDFGHVLVIGGYLGMSGAAVIAAMGAARVGAGLTTIATCKEHSTVLNIMQPEIMCHGISEPQDLDPLIERANAIVLGPGLGCGTWSEGLFEKLIDSELPLLIDADALKLLATNPRKHFQWILTPHPGEAARLLNTTIEEIEQDRFAAITKIRKQYGGVCVLKGAGSLIFGPSERISVCTHGNPGMASGGMGDLLSGVIAGLIAQGLTSEDAAKLGVCIHANAGDLASKDGERGMLATDLLPFVRKLADL